jgi:hypothetical protein
MTTCARCGADVGDAASCPRCGQVVLSPQSPQVRPEDWRPEDWRTEEWRTGAAERPAVRVPVEPAPAGSMPGPARFPLYADELDVAAHPEPPAYAPAPPPASDDRGDRDSSSGAGAWVAWAIVALVMVLVAVGGVWLLFAPGDDRSGQPASSDSGPSDQAGRGSTAGEPSKAPSSTTEEPANQTPSAPAPAGNPEDVTRTATARAPRSAPPNEDAFGNRTTYVAANMLDGRPDTCWRMAGDGTGAVLTFRLASPTAMTRVGLINGYAKNAVVGSRNLNWYIGNRRILAVQWVFDDGTTVDQPLNETKKMQTLDLGAPVTTSTVRLRLMTVSLPGTGRSARDYTAVSEVTLVGSPS